MAQKEIHQKIQSVLSDFFNDLFINGIDGVIILFFITTGLMSAGISNRNISTIGIAVTLLVALIMSISTYIARRAEKKHFINLGNRDILDAEYLKEKRLLENLGIEKHVQSLAQEEIEKEHVLWQNLKTKLGEDLHSIREEHPFRRAVITGASYISGGIIPLLPYFFISDVKTGLHYSSILSLPALFILGYFKSVILKTPLISGAITSLLTGALAGVGGYFLAKFFV